MGCAFCASTLGGLIRKLEPFEMLDQVLFTQVDSGLSVSHIVLMGIGEPLDNLDHVLRFLELVNHPEGMNISMRHISLSTCGLVRKLEPFEMLDQVLFTQLDSGLPVSHIVLMGIGEPLDNLENVLRFLELVNSPEGMNISMRHISLSTCGLVPKIDELASHKLQISLAISLHGPNDEIRDRIMPVNKAYPIEVLLEACRRYYAATSRRIHFEYAMIDGVNDSVECAKELLRRLKGLPAHVNLIPLNHVEESPLKPSSRAAVQRFQQTLEDGGVTATVRRTLGGDIDASCGQLRRKYNKEKNA